ncbi:cytosine-purine permease [Crassisporium funariophilum]|nr:cytosine-purine permease [Crassisporium funariophilum]
MVEPNGITPIPPSERTDTRLWQMFSVWFSASINMGNFSVGSVGPAFFAIGLRDSVLILLVSDIIISAIPAYYAIFGPKLGTRTMVQVRFSWGYYGGKIPSALNVLSQHGFLITNLIAAGQLLASVSDDLSPAVGIVVIGIITFMLTICGYGAIHWFESFAWVPNVISIITLLAVGGKHLTTSAPGLTGTGFVTLASFASLVTASQVTWFVFTPDYGVHHSAKASSVKIFTLTYLGFLCGTLPVHLLGAAFAASASSVPSWQAGFDNGNDFGGLFLAILAPTKAFSKILTVVTALSFAGVTAPIMYTLTTSSMSVSKRFGRIPRYVWATESTAVAIPLAIIGEKHFYSALVDIISVIGYWTSAFAAVILTEHFIFRRGQMSRYNVDTWDQPSKLPLGIAAILAFIGAWGMIIPCISQSWYIGPIAKLGTGDLGVFTGFVAAALLYAVLRAVEVALSSPERKF